MKIVWITGRGSSVSGKCDDRGRVWLQNEAVRLSLLTR